MGMRLSELARRLSKLGFRLEKPGSGSHWKIYDAAGKAYPIPAHNGEQTEIDDTYINGCCRAFGLDPEDIKSKKRLKRLAQK